MIGKSMVKKENGENHFHNGFYIDGVSGLYTVPNPEWDYNDQEDDDKPGFAYEFASDFLRGSCHIFAIALARNCLLDTYNWKNKKGGLIHSFGMVKYRNKTCYIDVRGATTDFDEFCRDIFCFGEEFYPEPQNIEEEYNNLDAGERVGYKFAELVINDRIDDYL